MDFIITYNQENLQNKFPVVFEDKKLTIETNSLIDSWTNNDGITYLIIGKIIGKRSSNKLNTEISDYKQLENQKNINLFEGRFVVIEINDKVSIWSDNIGRYDVYWTNDELNNKFCICSSLEFISKVFDKGDIDQLALSQMLTIYGGRPLKKQTLSNKIKRLGVNEKLTVLDGKFDITKLEFEPLSVFSKDNLSKLDEYSDAFIEAIRSRASDSQNIVFLSSGWDSTSILAVLVHLFGPSNIDCVIGRMHYTDRSGIINSFELERAKKIADYYKVRLHIIDLDYRNDARKITAEVKPILAKHCFGNITGFNHYLITKGAKKIAKKDASVFVGEISDGAHNFGFSQYFSIFHPESHSFREYSDKMATYLFGPTFLKQLINEKHKEDPVWKIFQLYSKDIIFDKVEKGHENVSFQLLSTFFLSGGRIPLYSKLNTKILTKFGSKNFIEHGEKTYLDSFKGKINYDNLYSIYLHLYNSFHWQGGTVATLEYICDEFELNCHLPFLDSQVIKILSEMPESWGRGLDINNTKYPLKWMLKNKVDYPFELQEGPHSYTYDVDPNFSHSSELVNASSFRELYSKALMSPDFIEKFDSKIFNVEYIKSIIQKYNLGDEMEGDDVVNILNLGKIAILGLI